MKMAESAATTRNRRKYRFVNPLPIEFCCGICSDLLNDPVEVLACEHLYCRSCITTWLQTKSSCPQCQGHTTESALKEPEPCLRSGIGNLHVLCPVEHCNKITTISELERHITIFCGAAEKKSPKCDRCEQIPESGSSHDCVESLKKCVTKLQTMTAKLENELQEKSVQLASCEAEKGELKIQVQNYNREIQALKDTKESEQSQAWALSELPVETQEEVSVEEELAVLRQVQRLQLEIQKEFAGVEATGGGVATGTASGGSSGSYFVGPEDKTRPIVFSFRDNVHGIEFGDSEISAVVQEAERYHTLCTRCLADIGESKATISKHNFSKNPQAMKSTMKSLKNSISCGSAGTKGRSLSLTPSTTSKAASSKHTSRKDLQAPRDSLNNSNPAAPGSKKRSSSAPPPSIIEKFEPLFWFSCNFKLDLAMATGGTLLSSSYGAHGFKWLIILDKNTHTSLSLYVLSEPEDKSLTYWKVTYQLKVLRQGWAMPQTFTQYDEVFSPASNINGFREFVFLWKHRAAPAAKDALKVEASFLPIIVSRQPLPRTSLRPLTSFEVIEARFTFEHVESMKNNDEAYSPTLINFNEEVKFVIKRTHIKSRSHLVLFLHFVNETPNRSWINRFVVKLRIQGPKKGVLTTLIPPHPIYFRQMIVGPMIKWRSLLDPANGLLHRGGFRAEVSCNVHQGIPVVKKG